jgi:pyruvate/2-oxoglutarate dehydrogenase complex dihydrolipoamide dehydrogenase (E3) component
MKYDYHIVVIGAGSGGLVVASGAAGLGAKVALIEAHKMGGDCLNYGCVPSKAFLKAAHLASDISESEKFGVNSEIKSIDIEKVMGYVNDVIKEIEPHDSKERYEGLGVDVINGKGEFVDKHTVKIGDKTITGKHIVIATGSEAVVPSIPGLKDCDYLTNKTVFNIKELPKHLIVLGAGPIGLELGQGFKHLGSQVTVIDMLPSLFLKDDPEVGPVLESALKKEGVNLLLNSKIIEVKNNATVVVEIDGKRQEIQGDKLLVSLGRRPVTESLNLKSVGVEVDKRGFISTNKRLQSNVSNIYACGDVVGPFQFTHMAGYQAGIVIRNCIFKIPAKVDYSLVPWTTYTKPEVAHVGYTEPWAKSEGLYKDHVTVNLDQLDRAKTEHDRLGFLKLILGKKNKIIGATMVGNKAGEIIPLASLAIQKKMTPSGFMSMIFSYPTEAEIFKFAGLNFVKKGFKPWMKKIIKAVFL